MRKPHVWFSDPNLLLPREAIISQCSRRNNPPKQKRNKENDFPENGF